MAEIFPELILPISWDHQRGYPAEFVNIKDKELYGSSIHNLCHIKWSPYYPYRYDSIEYLIEDARVCYIGEQETNGRVTADNITDKIDPDVLRKFLCKMTARDKGLLYIASFGNLPLENFKLSTKQNTVLNDIIRRIKGNPYDPALVLECSDSFNRAFPESGGEDYEYYLGIMRDKSKEEKKKKDKENAAAKGGDEFGETPELVEATDAPWFSYAWHEIARNISCVPTKSKRVRNKTDYGCAPIHINRLLTDQRIFSEIKRVVQPLTLLIDVSGSMHPNFTVLDEMLTKTPSTQVVMYAGYSNRDGSPGKALMYARGGFKTDSLRASEAFSGFHENDIDLNVLKWLNSQSGERVWISDGYAAKGNGDYGGIQECREYIKAHGITRYVSVEEFNFSKKGGK